jgi:hypothetical protein
MYGTREGPIGIYVPVGLFYFCGFSCTIFTMPYWQILHKVGIESGQGTQGNAQLDQRKSESCGDKSGHDVL